MSKEQQQPSQQIEQAIKGLAKPWIKYGLELPRTSVVELSRLAGLPAITVLNAIAEGKIIINGSVFAQQAVVDEDVKKLRTAQPGPFYQKTSAEIWSEGQRYQRRFQFQPINTKGKPTRKRIEARVVEEQIKRTKISFLPYEEPDKNKAREQKTRNLELRWAKKVDQDLSIEPEKRLIQVISREAQFPTQNLATIKRNLERAQSEGRPFRFGCFVCLVNEWTIVDGKPVYKVSTDPNLLTRLEQDPFIERGNQLFKALEKAGVPYEWDFIIADTDAWELFGTWSGNPQADKLAIESFERRVSKKLCALFPEIVKTRLWSQVQAKYAESYADNFNKVLRGELAFPNIVEIISERYDYYYPFYQKYFEQRGFKPSDRVLEILSTIPPKRNLALYASQGPIVKTEYDCLVIGDRDPLRCGRNQSVLVPDLPIWYPYQGG